MTATPGPLGEEAAKLVEALAQWARSGVGDLPFATDSVECKVCPICQLMAALRHTKPETFAHLADASSSMVAAVRSVLELAGKPGGTGGVERIDLDDADHLDHVDHGDQADQAGRGRPDREQEGAR